MSIKKKFLISNILMLVIPIVLILIVSVLLLFAFIMKNPDISLLSMNCFYNPEVTKLIIIWAVEAVVIIVITSVIITSYLSRSILKPIKHIKEAVQNLQNGNLDFEVIGASDIEIHELCGALESLRLKLKDSIEKQFEYENERNMLLANISHDLKTPITSVKGYVEGILDGVANTPEKTERYLQTILSKANMMEELIENLSFYSSLELKKVNFHFEYIEICEFLRLSLEGYKLDLQNSDMELQSEYLEDGIYVKLDREKMRRAFSNIISNAVKYKKEGKGLLKIWLERLEKGIVINFEDRGIGIKKADIDRVFEGFYRSDPSRNSNIKGHGLGLSITKQIVESMGGRVWLKSEENVGTKMMIYLPIVERDEGGRGLV